MSEISEEKLEIIRESDAILRKETSTSVLSATSVSTSRFYQTSVA